MLATLMLPFLGLGLVTAFASFEEDLGDIVDDEIDDLVDDVEVEDIARLFGVEEFFSFNDDRDQADGEAGGDDDDGCLCGEEGTDGDGSTDPGDQGGDDTDGGDGTDSGDGTDGGDDTDGGNTAGQGDGNCHDKWAKGDDDGSGDDDIGDNGDTGDDGSTGGDADPDDPDPGDTVAVLLEGDDEDNLLQGGTGDDTILGEAGDDVLEGNAGDDSLEAGLGTDVAEGGAGDDVITGFDLPLGDGVDAGSDDPDADVLSGGEGNDTITGNDGDVITTGDGEDVVRALGLDQIGQSAVVVTDFDPEEDVLVLVDRQNTDVDFSGGEDASDTFDPATIVEIRAASDGAGTEVIYADEVIALLQGTEVDDLERQTAWLANRDALVLVQLASS